MGGMGWPCIRARSPVITSILPSIRVDDEEKSIQCPAQKEDWDQRHGLIDWVGRTDAWVYRDV